MLGRLFREAVARVGELSDFSDSLASGEEVLDKYRLAGLDERERGFSRPVEFERAGNTTGRSFDTNRRVSSRSRTRNKMSHCLS